MGKKKTKDKKRKKSFWKKAIGAVVILIFLLLAAAAYIWRAGYFVNHFYRDTWINGIDCSYLTKAQVKQLWLMHYSQMVTDPLEYLPNAQAHFPGAECGFDGKRITLRFEE